MVTFAPATSRPFGSVMVPRIVEVPVWLYNGNAIIRTTTDATILTECMEAPWSKPITLAGCMKAPSPTGGASLFKLFAQDLEASGNPWGSDRRYCATVKPRCASLIFKASDSLRESQHNQRTLVMTSSQQRQKKTRQPCKFSQLCLEINRDGRSDRRKAVRWEKTTLS